MLEMYPLQSTKVLVHDREHFSDGLRKRIPRVVDVRAQKITFNRLPVVDRQWPIMRCNELSYDRAYKT